MSNDPHLSTGDWLGIGGFAATVVGSVVGGVKAMLGKRDERITTLEQGHYDQVAQLTELKTCQENTKEHLGYIRRVTEGTNERLDLLMATLANRMPGGKRRTDE